MTRGRTKILYRQGVFCGKWAPFEGRLSRSKKFVFVPKIKESSAQSMIQHDHHVSIKWYVKNSIKTAHLTFFDDWSTSTSTVYGTPNIVIFSVLLRVCTPDSQAPTVHPYPVAG